MLSLRGQSKLTYLFFPVCFVQKRPQPFGPKLKVARRTSMTPQIPFYRLQGHSLHMDRCRTRKASSIRKKYPRYDIFDQCQGAKSNCQTDHAGAGN